MLQKLFRRSRRAAQPRTSHEARLASYPPPYPDGWYRLMNADELGAGQIRYLECLGRELVVWRGEGGESVHAMTAFCPHLGANLSYGRVKGDHIECPFHAWQLTGEGRVACVPYSGNKPDRVLSQTFPLQEVHGQVFMYHSGGDERQHSSDEPPYQVPRIAEVDDGRFVYRGHHDAGRVGMHIIEFAENSADFAHFAPVHGQM